MEFGRIEYFIKNGSSCKKVLLTLVGQSDEEVLREEGLRGLRLRRLLRLTNEAKEQGCLLSYEDLAALLLTSVSTLKRDVAYLEERGISIPVKGRRKRRVHPERDNLLVHEFWPEMTRSIRTEQDKSINEGSF